MANTIGEGKTNCGRYVPAERKAQFHFYGVTFDADSVFQNSVVFCGAEFDALLGDFINPKPDKNGRLQIRVFRWTCEDGTVKNAAAGAKSEARIRAFLEEHVSLADFLEAVGIEMTAEKFNALYAEELEKREGRGDNSCGKSGDAYEQTLRRIFNPKSKYRNAVHAPANKPDICKRWSVDMLERIGNETGLWND